MENNNIKFLVKEEIANIYEENKPIPTPLNDIDFEAITKDIINIAKKLASRGFTYTIIENNIHDLSEIAGTTNKNFCVSEYRKDYTYFTMSDIELYNYHILVQLHTPEKPIEINSSFTRYIDDYNETVQEELYKYLKTNTDLEVTMKNDKYIKIKWINEEE